MATYKVTYIMPAWFGVEFEAPDGLTAEQVWEHFIAERHYQDGEECGWSRGPEWWDEEIHDSEAEVIHNLTDDEVLFSLM